MTVRWWRTLAGPSGGSPTVWATTPAEAPRTPPPDASDLRDAATHAPRQRGDFLVRRALLRQLAAHHLGVPAHEVSIGYDRAGAPRLRTPPARLWLSAAHRGEALAMAVAASPIGLDIEPTEPPAEPAWNVLAPTEREALAIAPEGQRWPAFLRLWTAKEAYLKALGTGFAREPSSIAVTLQGGTSFTVDDHRRPSAMVEAQHRPMTIGTESMLLSCVILAES